MNEAFGLTGRTAIICGAASDIGVAIARVYAEAGARVLMADLDIVKLEEQAAALSDNGLDVTPHRVDVTRSAEIDALVHEAAAIGDGLDVMANIAGIISDIDVVDTPESELDRILAVNLKGVFFGCQSAARVMSEQKRGAIVNMASSGAFTAIPKLACYSMSKAGVVALTRTLAIELSRKGVRVNAVAPGFVEGGMTQRHFRDAQGEVNAEQLAEANERARKRNPLGMTGKPDDIANAFLYLASDASRYVTGQVIHANGGAYMP